MLFSLPYAVGLMQGLVLERLPENLFTVTRSQVGPFPPLQPYPRDPFSTSSFNLFLSPR